MLSKYLVRAFLLLFFCSCTTVPHEEEESNKISTQKVTSELLKIHTLNIGNGLCSFVECPGSQSSALIYDCGLGSGRHGDDMNREDVVLFSQKILKKKKVYVIVSHPDRDHYSMLPAVTKKVAVQSVWFGGNLGDFDTKISSWLTGIRKKNIPILYGERLSLKSRNRKFMCGDAKVRLISANAGKSKNANSLVVLLKYKKFKAIFSGDAEGVTELQAIDALEGGETKIDLLFASHHGSNSYKSNSALWAKKIKPKRVIYSSGVHKGYKHPRCKVRDRYFQHLKRGRIHTFSCYKNGTLKKYITDKEEYNTSSSGRLQVVVNEDRSNIFSYR